MDLLAELVAASGERQRRRRHVNQIVSRRRKGAARSEPQPKRRDEPTHVEVARGVNLEVEDLRPAAPSRPERRATQRQALATLQGSARPAPWCAFQERSPHSTAGLAQESRCSRHAWRTHCSSRWRGDARPSSRPSRAGRGWDAPFASRVNHATELAEAEPGVEKRSDYETLNR